MKRKRIKIIKGLQTFKLIWGLTLLTSSAIMFYSTFNPIWLAFIFLVSIYFFRNEF